MGLEKAGRLLLHLRPSYRRGRGSPLRRRPDVDELLDPDSAKRHPMNIS